MTLTSTTQYEVICNTYGCYNCEWITANSHKDANKILLEQTLWTVDVKQHYCPECSQKRNKEKKQ